MGNDGREILLHGIGNLIYLGSLNYVQVVNGTVEIRKFLHQFYPSYQYKFTHVNNEYDLRVDRFEDICQQSQDNSDENFK